MWEYSWVWARSVEGALLGNASSHRPGLCPLDPLHVRVSSSFIVFSDPCSLVCTRFNKGFELELELKLC